MDTPEEHRERWERWFERAGAPGFSVVGWDESKGSYRIVLVREEDGTRETITYEMEG